MNTQDSKLWSAYMDGEMSASEAAEFDKVLSPRDRARLAAETRFETVLGDCLRGGPDCPEGLWSEIQARLSTTTGAPARQTSWSTWAVAASLLLVAGLGYGAYTWMNRMPDFLRLDAGYPVAMAANCDEVHDFIEDHHWGVTLASADVLKQGHLSRSELMGARDVRYKDQLVVEVMYECCGKPMKVILVQQGTPAAKILERFATVPQRSHIIAMRPVGNTLAAVVGHHHVPQLLDTVVPEPRNQA